MFFLITWIVVGVVALGGIATTVVFKMQPDNAIEQIAEEVIKKETGLDVDLTPEKQ
jgi:hypothetical protein